MEAALVDSNILLRLLQPAHTQYTAAKSALAVLRSQRADLCIAAQNLVEFWAVATRPLANNGLALSPSLAVGEVRNLRNLFRLLEGEVGVADTWEKLMGQHPVIGKQTHDAHLAATMAVYGVRRLLTFNGDDFKRYARIELLSPETVTAQHGS